MNHSFTRIASAMLAFGFFISCSVLQSSQQKAKPSKDLSKQQIQQKIDSLDQQIDSGDTTAALFHRKGSLLIKLAQKYNDPTRRTSLYADAKKTLQKATELYGNASKSRVDQVQEKLNITWSNEHNQGVQIFQSDTTNVSPDYVTAAAHFNNATTIIPDSAISYKMGARAYYKNQQPEKAIAVLENAQKNISNLPPLLLEQLAFLYLENNQPQKAVGIYEQAESFSDQNLNLLHGLSNAYINAGNHQKAAELLAQLTENEPQNVTYRQSLATEYYFVAENHLSEIVSKLREGTQIENSAFDTADSLLHRAENQFEETLEKKPDDQELKLSIATFYQNSASKYQQLIPFVDRETKKQLEQKIKELLSSAIPLFEQITKQNPDNSNIWQNLYQAYSYLGMQEKARNAKSNL